MDGIRATRPIAHADGTRVVILTTFDLDEYPHDARRRRYLRQQLNPRIPQAEDPRPALRPEAGGLRPGRSSLAAGQWYVDEGAWKHQRITEDTGRVGTGSGRAKEVVVRLLGGINRGGIWRAARRNTLVTLVGGMEIDLADAELPADGIELTKVSLIGGLDLTVASETQLEVGGFTLIGGLPRPLPGEQANGPLVRVRCYGLVGGVDVHVR